ncbi:MAG TPA: OstA-like protein, partial [Ignavibacteriaceae bacterium]
MHSVKYFFLFLFLLCSSALSQESNDRIIVVGDSLVGKVVNGESIREVVGNVVMTQGNVVVNCDLAIQYLAKNEAELIGNVVVKQDSLTLKTPRGFYFGDLRKTKSTSGIELDDKKVNLKADSGEYFFNNDLAIFTSNVSLVDSVSTMSSQELYYYKNEDRAIAVKNVQIESGNNVINADSLIHFRKSQTSFAFNNVMISNPENNSVVYGDYLEDYNKKKFTIIDKNPVLMQIDSTIQRSDGEVTGFKVDTLIIKCRRMEAYRDSTNLFKAIDSVKIVRNEFSSVNDLTLYYRADDLIITEKLNDTSAVPVLWYDNSQLTGDSISIQLDGNRIKTLEVINNAFMLSQH